MTEGAWLVPGERVSVHDAIYAWLRSEVENSDDAMRRCFLVALHTLFPTREDMDKAGEGALSEAAYAATCALDPLAKDADDENEETTTFAALRGRFARRWSELFKADTQRAIPLPRMDEIFALVRRPGALEAVRFRMWTDLRFNMFVQLPVDLEWRRAALYLGKLPPADTSGAVECAVLSPWDHAKSCSDAHKGEEPASLLENLAMIRSPPQHAMRDGRVVLTLIDGNHRFAQWRHNGSPPAAAVPVFVASSAAGMGCWYAGELPVPPCAIRSPTPLDALGYPAPR